MIGSQEHKRESTDFISIYLLLPGNLRDPPVYSYVMANTCWAIFSLQTRGGHQCWNWDWSFSSNTMAGHSTPPTAVVAVLWRTLPNALQHLQIVVLDGSWCRGYGGCEIEHQSISRNGSRICCGATSSLMIVMEAIN